MRILKILLLTLFVLIQAPLSYSADSPGQQLLSEFNELRSVAKQFRSTRDNPKKNKNLAKQDRKAKDFFFRIYKSGQKLIEDFLFSK